MKIKIKGNRESFYLTNRVEYVEFSLLGDFKIDATSTITLTHNNFNVKIENRQYLFKLTEKIKGANLDKLILVLQDNSINNTYIEYLKHKSTTEIELLKAILLIYNWLEIPMTNPLEMNLEKKIFNDFIIEYSGNIGPQEDVYFIDKKHIKESNFPMLQRLIDLNLLAKLEIEIDNTKYGTYFIPLIKPGIPLEYFKTEFDNSGKSTHLLWKEILLDRDSRIKYWINNRY